jgi:hypothetical protein
MILQVKFYFILGVKFSYFGVRVRLDKDDGHAFQISKYMSMDDDQKRQDLHRSPYLNSKLLAIFVLLL